jgi:carbonic anhydrase
VSRAWVVGVMIREGAENATLEEAFGSLPSEPGDGLEPDGVDIDVAALLPNDLSYYHYSGSLTTPPCSEGVNWFVLRTPIELSKSQIDSFRTIIKANNRPVEPLNGRIVKSSQ